MATKKLKINYKAQK